MNRILPKDLIIVDGLPPKSKKGDKVSIDSEFFNQQKGKLHRPHGDFAFLGASYDGKTVYYITDENQIQDFYDRLDNAVHIYVHAKYDITQLRRFAHIPQRKKLWDCMLIEQIMYSGYYTDFGLADLARRYLKVYMPKDVRKSFGDDIDPKGYGIDTDSSGYTVDTASLSQEQLEYSCVDVAATWRVYEKQREIIDENDLDIWKDIELPFLWTLLAMDGVRLDVDKWTALAEMNGSHAQEIRDKYPEINLNSPKQVKEHLKELGYKVDSTNIEVLNSLLDECEFAKDLAVYRNLAKRASTYGKKFIEDYVDENGKIHADIYQMGAETGRTSCRAPNLQNQPKEFEYRDCFTADDGYCMIVADRVSQEPCISAYLTQDEKLIDAVNSDEKLYIRIARDVFEKDVDKESDEYKHIKSTVLGIFYGMKSKALAKRIGTSEETAQEMIDLFLETYPGVVEYIRRQHQAGDYVTSIYGRKIWLNKYSYQWENNALNAPIQSSAVDEIKLDAYRFTVEWCGEDFYEHSPLRLLVHDEIGISVPEKDCKRAMEILERVMVETAEEMVDGIRAKVDIFSGQTWACKH